MASLEQYLWRVQRTDNGLYETTVSATEPSVAPSDSGAINTDQTVILESRFTSIVDDGYVNLESTLADNQAVKINASNAAGGIDIDAGTGGIAIDTTNAISLDAAAESNFTTTSGNLVLDATVGLTNIDGGSGINIGTQTDNAPINVGTGSGVRTISVGNTTGASAVNVYTGTGGFTVDTASGGPISLDSTGASCNFTLATNADAQDLTIALTGANNSSIILDSQGTGADAIRLNSAGGIDTDAAGSVNINTSSTAADALRLSCTGTGGLDIDVGSSGLDLDTTGAINLATSSSTAGITLNHGTGGLRTYQPTHTSLTNGSQTLTIAQLLTQILIQTPSTARTLTLPTAANVVSGLAGVAVDDSIDFYIMNEGTGGSDPTITVAMGTGGTAVGRMTIPPTVNNAGTYETSGTAKFRLRLTNVTVSSEAYTVYRLG